MGITQTNTGSVVEVELEGDFTIASSTQLKDELFRAFASGQNIRVSLERVGVLDITAIQLLWAAAREAELTEHSLTIAHPIPEPILACIREAGIPFPSLLEATI